MIYSPLFEFYFKHEKTVHDFFVQMALILTAYLADGFTIYLLDLNLPQLSLLIFVAGFLIARFFVRLLGKQELFGGFANYGLGYPFFLGVGMWFIYLLMIRIPKFR